MQKKRNAQFHSNAEIAGGGFADVYVAELPDGEPVEPLFPAARQEEVLACKDERVRRQKYYAWKLLGYALQRSLGYKIEEMRFRKEKNGKWTTPSCAFSLSHSHGVAAVAVSDGEVGVDVEKIVPERADFLQKILTEQERAAFAAKGEEDRVQTLFEIWTKKESIFKRAGDGFFRPQKIALESACVQTEKLSLNGGEYALSVATESGVAVRYFFGVDLSE